MVIYLKNKEMQRLFFNFLYADNVMQVYGLNDVIKMEHMHSTTYSRFNHECLLVCMT